MNTEAFGTASQKYSAVLYCYCIFGTIGLWFILKIKLYLIHSQ